MTVQSKTNKEPQLQLRPPLDESADNGLMVFSDENSGRITITQLGNDAIISCSKEHAKALVQMITAQIQALS